MPNDTVILGKRQEVWIRSIPSKAEVTLLSFLDSFNDTYQAHWDREAVYGRQDPISTFKNTDRIITFSLTIPSSSVDEAVENAQKIWLLQRMLYPRYKTLDTTGDRVISTPPLIGVFFYPLITEYSQEKGAHDYLYGTVDTVSMDPNLAEGWLFTDKRTPFPKSYSFSMTLNVIHQNPVGWSENGGRDLVTKKLGNKYSIQKHFKG